MEEEIISTSDELRHFNREYISEHRKDNRSSFLRQRRLNLLEVEQNAQNLTLEQFKETLLELKNKKCTVNTLKKIKNACINKEYIEVFFRTEGAFDSLVRLLSGKDAQKQLEATGCLINLACGKHKVSCKISKRCGAYLVSFINGGSHFLQDLSAWAAGNLTLDCIECFQLLKAQGILPALCTAIKVPSPNVLQSVVFALNACMQYEDSDIITSTQPDLAGYLLHHINKENTPLPIIMDASFILSKFCYLGILNHLEFINLSTAEGIFTCLNNMILNKKYTMVLVPLLRCLGYLLCEEALCKHLLKKESLNECLNKLIAVEYEYLRREILWILTNILGSDACDENLFNAVFKTENIKVLLKPSEPFILQVIYFLSCLAAREKKAVMEPEILHFLHNLSEYEDECIQNAAKVFFNVLNCD
ncbi:uncharacterized protein LOC129228180 [Uloborus diversus]|uniref:uncharacterized protein LOC129228180 n=1 Tax=Uloborus diversus TaxID=327109 RepID=UPI00240A6084|nr:uncharacterized protein LOC129228180 [Uloborus diversus]